MSQAHRSARLLRRIGAVLAGALTSITLTIGTDVLMNVIGLYPRIGQPVSDSFLLLATVYRTVFGIAGSYVAARLAPDRPMMHAMALGFLGFAVSGLGAIVTWNKEPAVGHEWYPLALVVLALPTAWLGGKLCVRPSSARVTPPEIAKT